MRRIVPSLLVVGAAISGLTWACVTSPSFSGSKLTGPSPITVGSQATYRLTATRAAGGAAEDDTGNATWDVTPSSVARVERPGVVTALAEGVATVTATLENTVSTMSLRVLVAGDYHVSGTVRDGSGNPIAGASVATVGSPFAQTTTDANGAYTLSNLYGFATVRASVVNFAADHQINVNANVTGLDFSLAVPTGFVNVAGTWTTTLIAPDACRSLLPAAAQQRSYTVTIQQAPSSLMFTFNSPSLVFPPSFLGSLNASGLILQLVTDYYSYTYYGPFFTTVLDKLDLGQWINIRGQISIPVLSAATLTGTLSGEFDYVTAAPNLPQPPHGTPPAVRCAGTSNVTFTRTGTTAALRSRR